MLNNYFWGDIHVEKEKCFLMSLRECFLSLLKKWLFEKCLISVEKNFVSSQSIMIKTEFIFNYSYIFYANYEMRKSNFYGNAYCQKNPSTSNSCTEQEFHYEIKLFFVIQFFLHNKKCFSPKTLSWILCVFYQMMYQTVIICSFLKAISKQTFFVFNKIIVYLFNLMTIYPHGCKEAWDD